MKFDGPSYAMPLAIEDFRVPAHSDLLSKLYDADPNLRPFIQLHSVDSKDDPYISWSGRKVGEIIDCSTLANASRAALNAIR